MDFETLKDIEGLTLHPLNGKIPALKRWQDRVGHTKEDVALWTEQGREVGIVCGANSGGLEVLDVDSKFQLAGDNVMRRWADKVNEQDPLLGKKLVITQTVSGGFHVLYRCTEVPIDGNRKLAMRPPTKTEKEKSVCLIETRGSGGQIRAYKPIRNSYETIPTITAEERDIIIDSAYSLNEMIMPSRERKERAQTVGLTPMDAYDQECDASVVLNLLEEYGWTVTGDKGDKWELARPGKTRGISGTLDFYPGMFWTWSGSGQFDENRGYTYAGVYTQLVHDGDTHAATIALAKEGYGEDTNKEERSKLIDKMLGKSDTPDIDSEEELAILSRITNSRQSMDSYLNYIKTKREFKLGPEFTDLQKLMRDVQPGHYVAYAAASGVGKTSTVRQIINSYLNETDQIGLFASLELASRDLALRNAMENSGPHDGNYVDKDIVTESLISDKEYRESVINDWGRFFTIDSAYDIDVIFNMASVFVKSMRRQGREVGVIVVDFLQMCDNGSQIEKQPAIAQAMKVWAKKLDVVTVGLLQMNSTVSKYEEPTENQISGHKMLFQVADHGYFLYKNIADKTRIIFKSGKERWSLEGKCDLCQSGMKIHSEPHKIVSKEDVGKAFGNKGL